MRQDTPISLQTASTPAWQTLLTVMLSSGDSRRISPRLTLGGEYIDAERKPAQVAGSKWKEPPGFPLVPNYLKLCNFQKSRRELTAAGAQY